MNTQTQTHFKQEIAAIRGFKAHSYPYAFGLYLSTDGSHFMDDEEGRDYLFTIYEQDGTLTLEIDRYSQTHGNAPDFDVDAWEAEKLFFEAPTSRAAYIEMQHIARSWLSGRDLIAKNGDVIKGSQHHVPQQQMGLQF